MMAALGAPYELRRSQLETYFDRTAAEAWRALTTDAPVSRIRAAVRQGRDRMRATLLDLLPADLHGARLLDAGCGTGAFAVEAARRGASVVAVDLSANLLREAAGRVPASLAGRISFAAGDMLAPELGRFDHVVAMDSLIHYPAEQMVAALAALAARTEGSLLTTFAPRTATLSVLHAVGRLLPRGDRAPAIEPVAAPLLRRRVGAALPDWRIGGGARIATAFYVSEALALVRR